MKVIIDGIEYVPNVDIKRPTDEGLNQCLEILTTMRYFNEYHKMKAHAWDAINAIAPDLAKLDEEDAFNFIHGEED